MADKADKEDEVADKPVDEAEPEDDLGKTSKGKVPTAPEKALSTIAPKTGVMIPGLEFNQKNEFLGSTVLKLSASGIRLDSPNLTAVFPPGQSGPNVYNPMTGKFMVLTNKNSTFLRQSTGMDKGISEEASKVGTDTIAGYKCTHFKVEKYLVNPRTKEKNHQWTTEIWGTRELALPKPILNDCSKLTMMPPEFGFPMRVIRHTAPTDQERSKGLVGQQKRVMIDTLVAKKTSFDKCNFQLLTGYTPVKDEMELMMANDAELDNTLSEMDDDKEEKSVSR